MIQFSGAHSCSHSRWQINQNQPESTHRFVPQFTASTAPSRLGSAQICSGLLRSALVGSDPIESPSNPLGIGLKVAPNSARFHAHLSTCSPCSACRHSVRPVECLNLPVRFDPLIRPPETCKRRLAARRTFHHSLSIAIHCFIAPPHLCLCSYGSTDLQRLLPSGLSSPEPRKLNLQAPIEPQTAGTRRLLANHDL